MQRRLTSGGIDIDATLERVRGLPAHWYAAQPIPVRLSLELLPSSRPPLLTPRQAETLRHYADGLRRPEIAAAMGLSAETVDTHRKHAMQALDAHTLAHATAEAIRLGIIA